MAELVDALDSGSSRGNSVDVRVILAAILYPFRYLVLLLHAIRLKCFLKSIKFGSLPTILEINHLCIATI